MVNFIIIFFFLVFNLSNGVDVEETKRKVNHYKKENQTMILKNRERQVRKQYACSCNGKDSHTVS